MINSLSFYTLNVKIHLKPRLLEYVITSKRNDCISDTWTGFLSIHNPISSAVETYLLSVFLAINPSFSCATQQFYHVDNYIVFFEKSF